MLHSQQRSKTNLAVVTNSTQEHLGQNLKFASSRSVSKTDSFWKHALFHNIALVSRMAMGRRNRNCFGASHFHSNRILNASQTGSAPMPPASSIADGFANLWLNATAQNQSAESHASNMSVTTLSSPRVFPGGRVSGTPDVVDTEATVGVRPCLVDRQLRIQCGVLRFKFCGWLAKQRRIVFRREIPDSGST